MESHSGRWVVLLFQVPFFTEQRPSNNSTAAVPVPVVENITQTQAGPLVGLRQSPVDVFQHLFRVAFPPVAEQGGNQMLFDLFQQGPEPGGNRRSGPGEQDGQVMFRHRLGWVVAVRAGFC